MRKFFLPALSSLVFTGTSLFALEIDFKSEADIADNFKTLAGAKALSHINEDGGALRFTTIANWTFSRLALVDRMERPLGLSDGTVEVAFRFKALQESFGVLMRVTDDDATAYLFLLNLGESGNCALRIFKVAPSATPAQENMLVFKATKEVLPSEWYRLRAKITSSGTGSAKLEAEILPEKEGAPILSVEASDEGDPVAGPGQINLRLYATNVPAEIEVRKVSVTPEPTVLH